ncbi:MAG: hypothetical protein WCC37_16740 [Candidatus Sulfotelmatobacter sp.]
MKTTTIMSPMVHSDSINGIINDAEHVIAQVLTDAKSLYPWMKILRRIRHRRYSPGDFVQLADGAQDR